MTHCRHNMLEELQRRNFALSTISTYLHAVEQFARHFNCRPDRLNQSHFRTYQAYFAPRAEDAPAKGALARGGPAVLLREDTEARYLLDDTPYPKARGLPQILSVEEVPRRSSTPPTVCLTARC